MGQANTIVAIFEAMRDALGPSHWWPGETAFEIAVGAILTQNTNWKNVEKAIANLKRAQCLDAEAMYALPPAELAELIRPAGYYNIKTNRLRNFLSFLREQADFAIESLKGRELVDLRPQILAVKGIGPETADSILLYALEYPTFVVDAYTARMMGRHGLAWENIEYHDLQAIFMDALPEDVALYNEYHALIVRIGKDWCKKRLASAKPVPFIPFCNSMSMLMRFFTIALFLLLLAPASLAQEDGDALHETLQQEHLKADDREMEVRELTRKAGRISTRLSDIEDDISTLKSKIRAQEEILNEIRQSEKKTRQSHFELEKEKERITLELSGLMKTLWPVHLQNVRSKFEGVDSWAMFDRRFQWLSDIYKATSGKLEEARINSEKIAQNLEHQRVLEKEAEAQLAQVNKNKDRLLGSKYALRKNLKNIRKKRQSVESELSEILSTIEDLKYQLQSQKTKRFALYKRMLPWPVKGRIVTGFRPKANPPVRGLVMGTEVGSPVQSVFWGKVVHNDTLRGFGHVVIVYHGYDYYSLYAYLSETHVRNGQEVEKNEPLGVVGYNPKADGPGLYFELRFHQKPINPKLWLTALK